MMHLRHSGIISCLAACFAIGLTHPIQCEDKGTETKAKVKMKLPEAVEKALNDLATDAVKLKRELRLEEMKKIIAEISEVTKLSDEQKLKLEKEVEPAVDRSLVPWREEFDTRLRPYLSNEGEGALVMLSQWNAEQLVPSGFPGDYGKPEEDPGWKAALKTILTIEQFNALDQIASDRERKLNEQIATYLKPFIEKKRQARATILTTEIEDIKTLLTLPEDRVQQLEKIAGASADRAGEILRLNAIKKLMAMSEERRATIIMSARNIINNNDDDDEAVDDDDGENDETSRDIWVKGVTAILREDEHKRWAAEVEERASRSTRALAMMFLSEMDQYVLFSSEQRGKMELLATRALADKSKKRSINESISLTLATLFNADEVKTVLNGGQWERWEAAGRGEFNNNYGRNIRRISIQKLNPNDAGNDKKDDVPAKKAKLEIPDDESLLAAHFEKRLADKRSEMAAMMSAKLDEVRRVVKLSPDRSAYLEIAAKGAVEHALDKWRMQIDSWARSNMQGAKGEDLRARLASLESEDVYFGEEEGANGEHAVWKDALAESLTTEQKTAWGAEVSARENYRQRAYAWGILAELNRRYHLSNDQFAKLEPLLQTAVIEYFDDFMNMFGRGSSNIVPRYLITLVHAVPEDALQKIFNAVQWKQWKEVDSKTVAPWWESMKGNHRRKKQRE
ncbi:MAG: hypothetical protein K8R87_06745 [Verrucomicrobia bacterium]|nr:hypothetical protein [Verrucomicrobiota bacterium]